MIYFISPALGFSDDECVAENTEGTNTTPEYLEESQKIVDTLRSMDMVDLKKILGCSDPLAELNFERYQDFSGAKSLQALRYFDGIAYKALDVPSLTQEEYEFLASHLRILSGLYGILKPTDLISAYRLEMKTKLGVGDKKNLYAFWSDLLYKALSRDSDGVIVNLASKEYSQCIENYLKGETYITCTFKVDKGKGLKVQSTAAKQARGHMVRWIAQHAIQSPEDIIKFDVDGYEFAPELSVTEGDVQEFVFVKYCN